VTSGRLSAARLQWERRFVEVALARAGGSRTRAARELGLYVHRKERQGDVEQARIDAQLLKLDDLEREIASLERQLAAARAEGTSVHDTPAPPAEMVVSEEVTAEPTVP
jgi:hypothetical protein